MRRKLYMLAHKNIDALAYVSVVGTVLTFQIVLSKLFIKIISPFRLGFGVSVAGFFAIFLVSARMLKTHLSTPIYEKYVKGLKYMINLLI